MRGPGGWAGGMGMLGQRKLPVNSSHLGTWGERGLQDFPENRKGTQSTWAPVSVKKSTLAPCRVPWVSTASVSSVYIHRKKGL